MRAATWPLSSRIGSVPAVAVYLRSRPSIRTVCDVCEIFSSAGPAVSTRGVASAAGAAGVCGAGVCGAPPRPCAKAGASAEMSSRAAIEACLTMVGYFTLRPARRRRTSRRLQREPQLLQRLKTMIAVRREVLAVLADRDDRIEEAADRLDHPHQPLDVRVRGVALIRRRLDAIDQQCRDQEWRAAERVAVA